MLTADGLLCVVGPRSLDRDIVRGAGVACVQLNVGGVHGMAPWHAAPNLARFALAIPRAAAIIRRFRPDVVLVGGGYVCAPVAVAASMLRIPLLTLCVDVVPGWAVRLSARLSTGVATAFPSSLPLLPAGKTRVTGYPVREEFLRAERGAARIRFGLPPDATVVLAFGGSLGARAINRAVAGALDRLLQVAHVIHITGYTDQETATPWQRGDTSSEDPGLLRADDSAARPYLEGEGTGAGQARYHRYHPYTYLDAAAMADALAAADLVVCRAGAATLAELPIAGTPAVLVPGEFSAQEGNARFLAAHGAAVVIPDRELTPDRLAAETLALLGDRERLAAMAVACRALAHRDAAATVAALVQDVSGHAPVRTEEVAGHV